MKDLNTLSGMYSFSILDEDEILEKNSDRGVNRIVVKDSGELYMWTQALFDKLQECVQEHNVEDFTTILYIHLHNIYKLRADKVIYNGDNYRHMLYIQDTINNIVATDFNRKFFTDEANYDYIKLNDESHSIHHVVSNLILFILGSSLVQETISNVVDGKYRNHEKYSEYMDIIQYHIENFDANYI